MVVNFCKKLLISHYHRSPSLLVLMRLGLSLLQAGNKARKLESEYATLYRSRP